MLTVRLETIKYGGWDSLEVAIDINQVDGKTLYVTYPTAETILNYRENSVREKVASKSFKLFLGEGLPLGKFSGSIVNKLGLSGARAKVNLIELSDLIKLAAWEASNGNTAIAKLLAIGFGDSLRSLAYEQLGIEITAEDRQSWIKSRFVGKQTRRTWTDAVSDYINNNEVSENYRTWVYKHVSDSVNVALFGKKAKQLCEERKCDRDSLRDTHDEASLRLIDRIEDYAMRLIDRGLEPKQAILEAIDFYK
jgi:hypothetical protein